MESVLNKLKDTKIIVGFVVLCVLIYVVYKWYKKESGQPFLIKQHRRGDYTIKNSGGNITKINPYMHFPNKVLPITPYGNGYSYSFWLSIDNWEYNYNKPKHIFSKGDRAGVSVNPGVWLYPKENNLMIRVDTFDRMKGKGPVTMSPYGKNVEFKPEAKCDLVKIPLQRWNHIIIVLNNKTLDVYLNGKLTRSCTYNEPPIFNQNPIHVTDNGGFGGQLGELRYFNRAIEPDEVYSIYSSGNKTFNLYSMFSKIKNTIHMPQQSCAK